MEYNVRLSCNFAPGVCYMIYGFNFLQKINNIK